MFLKNLKQIFNRTALIAVLAISTILAAVGIVFATTPARAADVPAYRLQISPTQANLGELEPGKTYTGSFKVQNTGSKAFDFKAEVAPYTVQSENYDPDFSTTNKYTEIVDWTTLSVEEGSVEANSQLEITYTIEVPENAPGRGESAAILVSLVEENTSDSTGVQTVRQAAFLLYSNVAGTTVRTGNILENKVPSFLFEPPVIATSKVENTGNIYTVAKYVLEVKELFGDKVVYTNTDAANGEIVFPETERYNEVAWESAPQLGIFKVKQTITIFDEESVVEKIVFLCPIWFLVVVVAFLAILIFMILGRIFRKKDR